MSSDQTDDLINHINHIIASVNNADLTTVCDALCSTTQLEGHIVILHLNFNDSPEKSTFIIHLNKINVNDKDTDFSIRKSKESSARYKSLRSVKGLSNISITFITETKQQHDDMFNDSKLSRAKISTNNASGEDSIRRVRENDHIQQNNINNNANNNDETKQQIDSLITAVSNLASAMQNMERQQNARIDTILQNMKQQQQQQTPTSAKTNKSNNNKNNNNDDDATSLFDQSDDDEDAFNSKNHNNNSIFNPTKTASTPAKNQQPPFELELIINKFRDLHNIIFLKLDIGSLARREIRDIKGWIASLKQEMTTMNTNVPEVNARHLTTDINTMTQNLEHALESLHLYGQESAIIQIDNNAQLMALHQKRLEYILDMLHNAALFVLIRWEFMCCLSSKNYARSFTNGAVSSIDNYVYKGACRQADAAKKWMDHLARILKTRGDPEWTEKSQKSSRSLYHEWIVVSKDYKEFVGSKNSTPKH